MGCIAENHVLLDIHETKRERSEKSETSDSESSKIGLQPLFVRFPSATGARRTNSHLEQSLIWRSPDNNRLPRARKLKPRERVERVQIRHAVQTDRRSGAQDQADANSAP